MIDSCEAPLASQTRRPVDAPRLACHLFLESAVPFLLAALLTACDGASQSPLELVDGWTRFAPSPDARRVHVSSSSGNDANDGLSELTPKATIEAAIALLRTGNPDWLLVKRGDEFAGGLGEWIHSGLSAAQPMVVTTFGPAAARPIFRCDAGGGIAVHKKPVHDVAFVGLHFVSRTDDRNDESYGVSLLAPCTRVLIEDCKIERFFTNLRFQGPHHRDLRLRRSVVADAFTTKKGHAQGIYVEEVCGCLIEECVFDHNGWRSDVPDAPATKFRHNIYIQGNAKDVVIRGNIIARGASHGLQARSGGDVRDNLFLGNAINLLVGDNVQNNGAVTASVIGNVMLDGRDMSAAERRGWAAQFQCLASGEIACNVAAHQVSGTDARSFELDSTKGVGIRNVDFHHNVIYRWGAPLTLVGNRFDGLVLRNNHVQECTDKAVFCSCGTNGATGFSSLDNCFHATGAADRWVMQSDAAMSLEDWKKAVHDTGSVAVEVAYPDPDQTIADYDRAAGGRGSLESFLARARLQAHSNWSDPFVGTNAAKHFRANFAVSR